MAPTPAHTLGNNSRNRMARSFSPKRTVIQSVKALVALREDDVHAVTNERLRRYPKLSWRKLRSYGFCPPHGMLVCSVSCFVCCRVNIPDAHRYTKRQAGDYRLLHVPILLVFRLLGAIRAAEFQQARLLTGPQISNVGGCRTDTTKLAFRRLNSLLMSGV
jgi:hypothetical protein